MSRIQLITLLFLVTLASVLIAQTNGEGLVREIEEAYNQLNYAEAEAKALNVLKSYNDFTPSQLTEIHKFLGLIYYSQNKTLEARREFESALLVTPELALDPLYTSPKILTFFNQIKDELAEKAARDDLASNSVRYVFVQDPRPAAALRSMVLPGWGQLYKGERSKGIILSALWGAGAIATVSAHIARNSAEDKYLAETNPDEIQGRYDTFSRLHKIRNNLLIFSAGVWLFSYIDAVTRQKSGFRQPGELSVSPIISRRQSHLTLTLHF